MSEHRSLDVTDAREIAEKIVFDWTESNWPVDDPTPTDKSELDLVARIASALSSAHRAPDGHVREGDVDRKLLGTSTNKDGPVYRTAMMLGETVMVLEPLPLAAREAALSARERGEG